MPLLTLWHNLHMFLDILEFTVKNKKIFRENCFDNVVSHLWKELFVCTQNYFKKKVQILRKIKTKNHESVHNLWRILQTKIVLLVNFWDQIAKQFSLNNYLFCFLFYTPKCLETCVNCVKKCIMAKIYPMKFQILETKFSYVTLLTI